MRPENPRSGKHWYRRVWPWVLIGLVVLIAAIRVAATPLASHFTRQALDRIPGYKGTFEKVKLSFIHLRYTIDGLKLVAKGEDQSVPEVYVGTADGQVLWSDLFHLHLAGAARVDHAKVTVVMAEHPPSEKPPPAAIDLQQTLTSLFPFRIDRVELHRDQLLVIDRTEEDIPDKSRELWVHDIEATLDNVGTRRDLTKGEPTTFAMKAKIQRSGTLTVFVTADLLSKGLNFAGETSLRGLELNELWGFLVGKSGLKPVQGTLDAFAAFKCVHGEIDGAVKPELKNAKLAAVDSNLVNEIKGKLADTALSLSSDRVPGRNANVAVIPLKGRIQNPKAELWPTVLSVLRNAYVEAIAGGFAHVPTETSAQKQGPMKQAAQAFNPKKFPKAQPQKGK